MPAIPSPQVRPLDDEPGPSRSRRAAITAALLAWLPTVAQAQSLPAKPATPTQTAGDGEVAHPDVIVSGQRPAAQSSIDRKTYQISHDLQSASGSASDVLRNLPAVDVDAQGNVSLRGDPNVQILIDGKTSTTLSTINRADTLEQFPANTIDHIEVITNPSAQFKPDGSAGIINIVTRKNRKPGASGSVQASAGSDGRFNIGGKATWHSGPLTVTGNLNLRRDMRWRPFSDRRTEIDPVTGQTTGSNQDSLFRGAKLSRIVGASVDYDLTASDRLSASGSYNQRTGNPRITQHNVVTDASGAVISDYDRTGGGDERENHSEVSAKYRHSFSQTGREFTLDLRRGESIEDEIRRFTNVYRLPAGLVQIDQQHPHPDELEREATAEYAQPLWGGKLLAGYDLQRNDDDYRNHGDLIDPVTGVATTDPSRSNRFVYGQTVHAWYATYDRSLAKSLTAILGLRLEQAIISTNQVDLGLRSRTSYFRAYPTFHLQYDLSAGQDVKLSYSHRVVRPDPEDLNPYPAFSDSLNLRAGNPNLKPQETHSFEAGYHYEANGLSLEATLFLRKTWNGFTDVSRFISPTVLLTTKENLGRSTAGGVDFSGSGKLSHTISYRLSGTFNRTTIDASNLGFAGTRSAFGFTGKAGMDFQLARPDLVQVSTTYTGRRLTPQGYRLPAFTANIGYRHRFASGLTAVLSVADIFNTQRERILIDGAVLRENSIRRNTRRAATLALSLPFGGKRNAADTPFDFGE